jgi:hypothetical protein
LENASKNDPNERIKLGILKVNPFCHRQRFRYPEHDLQPILGQPGAVANKKSAAQS